MAQISFNAPSNSAFIVSNSANWNTGYTFATGASAKLDTTHTWVTSFSSDPVLDVLYIRNALGVGISNPTQPLHVVGNTLVEGNLTATGTLFYKDTLTTTYTALSVDNEGTVTALFVKQRGNQLVAEFKDGEDVALTIHGHSDKPGFVGVKISDPNKELTVKGEISATGFIYSPNISSLQGVSGVFATVSANSASWSTAYSYVTSTSAGIFKLQEISGSWSTAYSYVTGTSAGLVKLQETSGNWNTAYSYVTGTSAGLLKLQETSGNWNTAYSYVTGTSAGLLKLQGLSSKWDSAFSTVSATSGNLARLQAVSSTWSDVSINFVIDGGGGSTISTGSKGTVVLPTAFLISEWTLMSNINTSITVDVLSSNAVSYPTSSSITVGNSPSLTNQSIRRSSVSWVRLSAGDILEFFVTANTTASVATLSLKGTKS